MAIADSDYLAPQPYSFRDPDARLSLLEDRVVRYVRPELADELRAFLCSPVYQQLVARGSMIATQMKPAPDGGLLLEHPRIFFPSYCWEWSRSMWIEAGRLTLELARILLEHGFLLKDATPRNVLFENCSPVFVDIGSVVRRPKGTPIWTAYAQFVRTFILPLLAERLLGWPLSMSANKRDGYEPPDLYRKLGLLSRLRPGVFSAVTMPSMLESFARSERIEKMLATSVDDARACASLKRSMGQLAGALEHAAASPSRSQWSSYDADAPFGQDATRADKQAFVVKALSQVRAKTVLDIGANVGTFSRVAASTGASVVALERDTEASDANFRVSREKRSSVLPLNIDFSRPTPATGWNNGETLSFQCRAEQRFDVVMALAVIHHMLAADQVPLPFVEEALSRYSRRYLLLEWVPVADEGFRHLSRGRDALFSHLTPEYARSVFTRRYHFLAEQQLSSGRLLWLLEKNTPSENAA
jgi:2-polyprenyl-3-methyl-5-hydroxy-6-metoxy-1,4-benzoquinol methylase